MRESLSSYLLGGLLLAITSGCALLIPWLLKLAIESIQHPLALSHSPAWYGMTIIVVALLHGIIRIFSRTTLLHNARRIEFKIREELYAKLLQLDLTYFNKERTGDLISRFSNDLTNVRMLLGFGVLNLINTAIIYTASLILMVKINPLLTLFATLPFPAMILIVKRISAAMFRRSKRAQEELAALTSTVEENISAAAVIKAYCREEHSVLRFAEVSDRYMESNMRIARMRGLMIPVMAATGALGTLIVLLVGGGKVVSGVITLGDFVAFSGYLTMLIWPTIIMGWILNLVQRGAASMSRLNEILQAESQVMEPQNPLKPDAIKGDIVLKNLCFSFGSRQILKNISLSIPAGSRLGIVGSIGAGKSTLVKLVSRLYPAADGSIFIDGNDINRLSLQMLRDATGYVPQESFLFSRSIAENIAFGLIGPDIDAVRRVSRSASLDKDVERFPDGYDSMVGERGITLSGGQKQRAAIARALIKEPSILILDDPLSSVDATTEEEILSSLRGYYGDRTVIIISHRLSALRDCDTIIYLEDGTIIEKGSHNELLALKGRYAALHREQELRFEIGEM
ncbi:MAG: ABC transporter ATP-binding protein [Geobacteraceae bacterium]|nr:ABC transporter ATP-binding protein [Geobacteraceae bacterium]